MLESYTGTCHCGAVKFEADLDLSQSSYRSGGHYFPGGRNFAATAPALPIASTI